MDFKSKTVIITGASSGIGLALAREFAAAGANVVMGARSEDKLAAVATEIKAAGGAAAYTTAD